MSTAIPVVLVHGAWHGAWCWAGLQHALDCLGVPSYASDLPGHGASTAPLSDLHGDADHVAAVLDRLPTPVVLVGHSYGGAVITEAATRHPAVAHLVYLTAFALDKGESITSLLATLPRRRIALGDAIIPRDDATSVIDESRAAAAFYGECPAAVVDAAVARLSPQPMSTFTDVVTGTPRDQIRSTYVRCLRDQAIHISHQDAMATRCDVVHTLDTDHSPFASRISETSLILARLASGS